MGCLLGDGVECAVDAGACAFDLAADDCAPLDAAEDVAVLQLGVVGGGLGMLRLADRRPEPGAQGAASQRDR
ncbi:hypothetical protein CKO44_07640 [Rubrivivax gelatinosus]|nr:hypothetical protein [Rubrivivax gelatinosus]